MAWHDLTFTASHVLTASDMNRMQENFTAMAQGASGAPALAVNSFTVSGVASIGTLHVSGAATFAGGALPTGAVIPYAGATTPSGWLLCFGQAVSRDTFAALFALVGESFGAGDGSTTFNVHDLRGRAAVGLDNMGGTGAGRLTGTWADSLGGAGGAETHTLVEAEMPGHTHAQRPVGGSGSNTENGPQRDTNFGFTYNADLVSTQATGGDQPHNNVQPSMALNYLIKH